MIYEEKTSSTERVYEGKVIKLRVDKVQMPDKTVATREIVEHPGGVGVVAVDENMDTYLVCQFRKPLEKAIYEIPAGKLNYGEDHRECGIRELEEETGLKANKFEYLGNVYPSPGFLNEIVHIYLAQDLYMGKVNLDPDEYLDVVKMPLEKAIEMVMNNEINDAKSVAGLLKAAIRFQEK